MVAEEFLIEGKTLKKYNGKKKVVVVPNSITEIGVKAFYGMGTNNCIENIILPDSMISQPIVQNLSSQKN